jgi:hypothetical protein
VGNRRYRPEFHRFRPLRRSLLHSLLPLFGLILLMSGCIFETPLAEKPTRKVDPKVLGIWHPHDDTGTRITISASDEWNYQVLFVPRPHETVAVPPMTFDGHHTAVGDIDVINLKLKQFDGKDPKRPWLFCTYKAIDENTVDVHLFNEKFVPSRRTKPLNTSEGLREAVSQPGFFLTKPLRLIRSTAPTR